jgi:hypothetical protein
MTGEWVARDLRMRVMPPVLAYNEDIFRNILKAFDNLQERADEQANEFYNNYPGDEYTDPGDVADWAQDHSYAWWETMVSLRQSMLNLLATGLYHLVEQQLAALSDDCAYERVRNTDLRTGKQWYAENLGVDLSWLAAWAKIDELRLVANSVKHADGGSARQLREIRPDLFENPAFAHILAEIGAMGDRWVERQTPLSRPLAGEDLFVTEDDMRAYTAAARSLFEGIVEFCEERKDDRFPVGR